MAGARIGVIQKQHRQRHIELHRAFDELIADFFAHHRGKMPSNTTITELMEWSYRQTIKPTEAGARR